MSSIIACLVRSVFLRAGTCIPECKAYLCCADVLELLLSVPLGTVTQTDLRVAVDGLLAACLKAGWRQYMHPKFHWTVHLVIEMGRFGMLLCCWVHERKHKIVKRFGGQDFALTATSFPMGRSCARPRRCAHI